MQTIMVMTPNSELYEGSCSSADTLTSPGSSTVTSENLAFFSDEDMAQIESLDIASMMTPLIKEELKTSICRRLAENGKDLPLVDLQTVKTDQLSEEDEEKRNVRRLRNKMAAQKCRSKKREKADLLEQEAGMLEERQETLKDEVDSLKRELEVLQDMLDAHEPFCKKLRACADNDRLNDVQFCLSNDHTYTLTLEDDGYNNNSSNIVEVPSLSDSEFY